MVDWYDYINIKWSKHFNKNADCQTGFSKEQDPNMWAKDYKETGRLKVK